MLEREWQAQVVSAAQALGWTTYHTHDSRRSDKGWPDLVLVMWLDLLESEGVETYLWRPDDVDEVLAVLSRIRRNTGGAE